MRRNAVSLYALTVVLALTWGGTHGALAQPAPTQFLQSSPIPHIAPPETPKLGAGLPNFVTPGVEGPLPSATIAIGTVTVVGATAFPPAVLNKITAGLAGTPQPLTHIEAIRRALVAIYRAHGFVLSTVSLDIDAQGNVRYIVTEGHIVAVKLSADIGPAGTTVLGFLDHLTAERPVNEASLERWLLLAQQIPGVSVHAVLQADSDDPGALTLIAEVSRQAESGLITADDRAFKSTGPVEALAVADLNSLTSYGDQTELSLFHTSGNTDNFGQASESFFIGSSGLRVKVYAGEGRGDPGGVLRLADYQSLLQVFGGQLSYPAVLRRNQALNLTLHLDGTQNLVDTNHNLTSFDSIRAARLATQYAVQDLLLGNSRQGVSVVNIQESQGLPALGASPDRRAIGEAGRANERLDFWKISGSAARNQTLFSPFGDATVAMRLEAGGQYSPDILPSAEEFDLGGSRFTRGYYSGEVSGDKALYATAELQLNTGTDFDLFTIPIELGAQFYTFYDYGETFTNLEFDENHRLASFGAGVHLGVTRYLEIDGEIDHRLVTRLDPQNTTALGLSETVIYWGVTARY
jgi:hemolysin activation/secretion protein